MSLDLSTHSHPSPGFTNSISIYGEMRLNKRKLDSDGNFNHMETTDKWSEQMENSLDNPKRLCLEQSKQSQMFISNQTETLPGCLDDSVTSSYNVMTSMEQWRQTSPNQESQAVSIPMKLNTADMEEDLSHQSLTDLHRDDSPCSVSDPGTSMDTDFVPDNQQYNLSSQPSPPHSASTNAYCGCVSCKGLKPSPVTGRYHCHCSASWRGMYGIGCSFYSDYY